MVSERGDPLICFRYLSFWLSDLFSHSLWVSHYFLVLSYSHYCTIHQRMLLSLCSITHIPFGFQWNYGRPCTNTVLELPFFSLSTPAKGLHLRNSCQSPKRCCITTDYSCSFTWSRTVDLNPSISFLFRISQNFRK